MAKQFSRRVLYDLIWSKPMREAAKEVGVSNVRLAKVCRAAGIPIPAQGHWNKIRAGKGVEILDLPPRPPDISEEVIIGGGRYSYYGFSIDDDNEGKEPIPPS